MVYTIAKNLLPSELGTTFFESRNDKATQDFINDCRNRPLSKFKLSLCRLLNLWFADYEVHGILKMYPMHLLSSAKWLELIGEPKQKLLDIGAGQGFVTEQAKNIFEQIFVTETSKSMLKILKRHGFIIYNDSDEKFDVVSILNVLDRCDFPLDMLDNAVSKLKPDGILLIATPLPLNPYVRAAEGRREQKQPLPMIDNASWEKQLINFNQNILQKHNLEIVRFTRLPYIWKDVCPWCFSYLDDAVMACKKVDSSVK